jgi:hypothetical protein
MTANKKPRKKKTEPPKKEQLLKGYICSGLLFIGDPGYLAGDLNDPAVLADRGRTTRKDNPFYDYEYFTHSLDNQDKSLSFNGGFETNEGMGVALQLSSQTGKYVVTKELDEEGRVINIHIALTYS